MSLKDNAKTKISPIEAGEGFRLANIVGSENNGLLLYNNGTVCGKRFSANSANAICRAMGYSVSVRWASNYNFYQQFDHEIRLGYVHCTNNDLDHCTYSTANIHDCVHSNDVFLACGG